MHVLYNHAPSRGLRSLPGHCDAHRLGQHKPIRAVRFVVRNTVEERILRLQDKKRLVFEGTVGGDAAALGQLSEEDLRFLFQN